MAAKKKAKRRGRPPLTKDVRREKRSLRLLPALWRRIEAHGNVTDTDVTATIEKGMTQWLDEYDRSLS